MYLVKTTIGDIIPVDSDELIKIAQASPDTLIFLRNGAVQRRMISTIVKDENKAQTFVRLPGETDEDVTKRIEESRSEDIFQILRNQLSNTKELPA